jgi:hypothetical protein
MAKATTSLSSFIERGGSGYDRRLGDNEIYLIVYLTPKEKTMKIFTFCSMFILTLATAVAQQHPINISSKANYTWCSAEPLNCATFPFGTKSYNGVTFDIPGTATTDNVWSAYEAANAGSEKVSVTIPVNIKDVKTVYTLMNTEWGSTAKGLLAVTFTGTNGATWTYDPVGNVNIRDYNNDGYTNAISCALPTGPGTAATVSGFKNGKGQRLDMQIYELPATFAGQTLVSVTVTDTGNSDVQRSVLAALTVSTAAP